MCGDGRLVDMKAYVNGRLGGIEAGACGAANVNGRLGGIEAGACGAGLRGRPAAHAGACGACAGRHIR